MATPVGRLSVDQGGALDADLRISAGPAAVKQFLEPFMGGESSGRPRLVSVPGHIFTDGPTKVCVVDQLRERRLGRRLDPRRFRANLYIQDLLPRAEFGRKLTAGDARFHVAERIDRCAATNSIRAAACAT